MLYSQMFFGHLMTTLICGPSPICSHNVGSKQLSTLSLYPVDLRFPFTEMEGHNLFQHDIIPVHTTKSMKLLVNLSPDLNSIKTYICTLFQSIIKEGTI